jgi:hypothetical protein
MAHFAQINENNVVTQVIVVSNVAVESTPHQIPLEPPFATVF